MGAYIMKPKLTMLVLLLPLISLAQSGRWHMDFDDDLAAAAAVRQAEPGGFTITFLTGVFPETIALGASYAGPAVAANAFFDPGDGNSYPYSNKTITVLGNYVRFSGDWRTSAGIYAYMFSGTLNTNSYTCEFSGGFTNIHTSAVSAYRAMFYNCTAVTSIRHNPLPRLSGGFGQSMFRDTFSGMSGVTGSLPQGFLDTSGMVSDTLRDFMFFSVCRGMSGVTGSLPQGFLDLSGLSGSSYGQGFVMQYACAGMTGITGGNITISADYTAFSADNASSVFRYMFDGCSNWQGYVYWGGSLLTDAFSPSSDTDMFRNCASKPNFGTLHANWK